MGFLRVWLTLEVRRRWRSLAALALIVAFALATVLAAVAGARRGASAYERLRAVTLPADAQVLNQDPDLDWDRVRAIPGVAGVTAYAITRLNADGVPLWWNSAPPIDTEVWRTIERPVLLSGRLPDPARPDEVAVLPRFVETYGKGVGDAVTIHLSTPQEVDLIADSADAPDGTVGGHGPRVRARIVGVIRSPWFTDPPGQEAVLIPSPGLFLKYRDNLLGLQHRVFSTGLVRLADGEKGLPAFRARLAAATRRADLKVTNLADMTRHNDRLLSYEAVALLVFGLAALAAAALVIGQFVSRLVGSSLAELRVLRPAGLTPRQAVAAASLGPVAAAGVGALFGTFGAAVATVWMPIGAAAAFEPTPGLDLDWAVLAPGLALAPVMVALAATAYGWVGTTRSPRAPAPSRIAAAARGMGCPVPILTGLRFALERGHGRGVLPVRSTLVASSAGVLGVLAALTFSTGVHDAAADPGRFGQTHEFLIFIGVNGQGAPPQRLLPALARDPDVTSAEDAQMSAGASRGLTFSVFGFTPFGTSPLAVAIQSGRGPLTDQEIMLAVNTAHQLGVGVGGRVSVAGRRGARDFTVSGVGFVPEGPSNSYAEGALTTSGGYGRLFNSFEIDMGLVDVRPGADPARVADRLRRTADAVKGQAPIGLNSFIAPRQMAELQGIHAMPVALGGFLATLALAATGNALITTARRRRHEIAVLRALGLTRTQARWIAVTQGGALAVVALGFGLPLGLALGRLTWRVVADSTPLLFVPPAPTGTLLLIVPAALLAAGLLAAWPARLAARLRLAQVLRAE